MNNYIVYRHTSPSSKVYIGITCQKPERRWSSGYGYKDSPKFYNAIQKYGWTNFKHEILYSGLNEISAKLIEEDLIYYYKSLNISYNITDGGDGTRGVRVSPSEETRKKLSEKTKEIMRDPEIRKRISASLKGRVSWIKGKHHSKETKEKMSESSKSKKSVSQYSKDGKLIKIYNSITEAANETKINISHISSCCSGLRKTAGGFIWKNLK